MSDIDYGELFGIEPAGEAEETSAGAAEKPDSEPDAGTAEKSEEREAEPATPQEDGQKPGAADKTGDDQGKEQKQSDEDNARYAAARRKAEREAAEAIAKVKADAKKEIDDAFKNSGMINPYTKQPITSKQEYDEYRSKYDEEQKARVIRKAGMSDEEFDRFVENLPQVREAKAAAAAAQEAQQQARAREAQIKVEEQLKEISEMDPSIKELADLTKMDNYDQFYELVKRGNTLTDAYKLVNFDKLVNRQSAASRQAAINAAAGKSHMGKTSPRGQGAVTVPADVREMYRMFNPDATEAEIQAHYAKNHKT